MKKFLLIFCLLVIAAKGYSQQFSQYNTGTLYDSFENPAQPAFIPDTSKMYAFNFLIPNFNVNFFLNGDVQSTVVRRIFSGSYDDGALQVGNGKFSRINFGANSYFIMFKMFNSLSGNSEIGISAETKVDGKGIFSDESVAILDGYGKFPGNVYDNIFNDHYYSQVYNALSLTYRENVTKQFALGIKLSALMGISYNKLDIYESHISFDKAADEASLSLRGKYYQSKGPGNFDTRSFLPNFRSPGAAISFGGTFRTEDGITVQANIKDLGFIHWYNNSTVSSFNQTQTIHEISGAKREDSIYNTAYKITNSARGLSGFTSATNAKFEISATKSYWLDDNKTYKYSPTLIAQKEMLYNGFTAAMVNRFQYKNYNVSILGTYDNFNQFNIGTQLMLKNGNIEFFLGSERLLATSSLALASGNAKSYTNGSFTGADFFLGFAMKFGPVIEHPMNASSIPNGEKGFIGRLWNRLFKTYR